MPRALWKAVIEFGAVAVPVKLYTAVRPRQIPFHLLHDQDEVRVRQQMVCPADGDREVQREHVVRGYELRKGRYVIVRDEDLEGCAPVASRTIQIRRFVDASDIDPLFYDKPYYLGPDAHGHRPYALLARSMRDAKRVAIVEYVLRGKQYLGVLRVASDGEDDGGRHALVLEQMRYADEVVPVTGDAEDAIRDLKVDERQVKMAGQLVEALAASFEPDKYHDEYRACVMEMIERKAAGRRVPTKAPRAKPATKGQDLTEILRASLAHAKAKGRDVEHPANRHKPRA
jgi:DNA end-binding protein Ku